MSTNSVKSLVFTGTILQKSTSFVFDWEIKQFSMNSSMAGKDVGSCIVSPEFSIQAEGIPNFSGIAKWKLRLYPNGYKDEIKDDVGLLVQYLGYKTVSAQVTLSLLNNHASIVVTHIMPEKTFSKKNCTWGFERFVSKEFIMDSKNRVLQKDTLKVKCEISISEEGYLLFKDLRTVVYETKKAEQEKQPLVSRLEEFDDYEKLLENGNFSDVTIVVGEEQFLAHKAIITSRSTVFEAMFKHDMKENEENTIEITDIKSEVVKEVLRFMYAGKVSKIEQMTSELLMAAEKYAITGLKKLCVQAMLKNLKIENALELLKLADMCNAPDLKSYVIEFIASNQKAIAEKPEFGLFKDLHSDLQFELVQAIIAKNSNQ